MRSNPTGVIVVQSGGVGVLPLRYLVQFGEQEYSLALGRSNRLHDPYATYRIARDRYIDIK